MFLPSTSPYRSTKALWLLAAFAACALYWWLSENQRADFVYTVPKLAQWPVFEGPWAYALILAGSFIPVFALSFDKRVHYHTEFTHIWRPTVLVLVPFVVWDVIKTYLGVWGFNPHYYFGVRLFLLPLEEWLFFVIIPFCCLFIHACLKYYAPRDYLHRVEPVVSMLLLVFFVLMAILNVDKNYTFSNFALVAAYQLWHMVYGNRQMRSRFYITFALSMIPFCIVNGILTGGYTQAPIVVYNPLEHNGFRMGSIPFEDAWYGYLMLFAVVDLYEQAKSKTHTAKAHVLEHA